MNYQAHMGIAKHLISALCTAVVLWAAPLRADTIPDAARVREIAALLAPAPAAFGQPITNRPAWLAAAAHPALKSIIADAQKMAAQPDPALPDDLYLDC